MTLAPYASDPAKSRGRRIADDAGATRGPRDAFQRDRDRIIHSVPFRRLSGKTQVFVAPDGDHFRVRLTHSLEVAQIARAVARALKLNEDLAEALALAHDIGHSPFGHAGEDALDAAMREAGGFDHNANTLRRLTAVETPYPTHEGYNLTWETLEGLAKHNGPVLAPTWALQEVNAQIPLELDTWSALEAQVAAIADDIAYDNHDIDDGLRAGLFTLEEVLEVPIVARSWREVTSRHPGVPARRLVPELIRHQIGVMVNDLLIETRRRIGLVKPKSPADVRAAGQPLASFSRALSAEERELKRFLYARMYDAPPVAAVKRAAQQVVTNLFAAFDADPNLLPEHWHQECDRVTGLRRIGDYIAGMTDRYAIKVHKEVVGPIDLPEGF